MYWDPEWVELEKAMGEAPQLPEGMTGAKKKAVDDILMMAASRLPPPPDNVSVYDDQIPKGPKVRLYKPDGKVDGSLPLISFIHGGGWFAGNLDTEDRTCRMISSLAHAVVVSVDYRCGVDVALETEVDDCLVGFHWACEHASELGADANKIIVLGGSAGGALAVAVAYGVVKAGKRDRIAGLVTMNGTALHPDATPEKYKHLMKSYVENAGPLPFVSGDDTMGLYKHWKITPSNINVNVHPAAFGPESVQGFPPTFFITSDNDASRDDSTVLEAMLKDVGVPAKRENFVGFAHYFWTFPLPKVNERFWKCLIDGIGWTLSARK